MAGTKVKVTSPWSLKGSRPSVPHGTNFNFSSRDVVRYKLNKIRDNMLKYWHQRADEGLGHPPPKVARSL